MRLKVFRRAAAAALLAICPSVMAAPPQENPGGEIQVEIEKESLPKILSLSSKDKVKAQFDGEVEENSRREARGLSPSGALFFSYEAQDGDTISTVSAALSIRQETLATANGFSSASHPIAGETLAVPSFNALFINDEPESAFEILLKNGRENSMEKNGNPRYNLKVDGKNFSLEVGGKLSPTERAFFVDSSLAMPVDSSRLSSRYGMRVSPISGKWKFHNGIDLAVPSGSGVFACKNGIVAESVEGDRVFGNYVVIDHGGGMTSLYAHLSKSLARKGDVALRGQKIGLAGRTGMATGPHLHFEIRFNGTARDPSKYLPER